MRTPLSTSTRRLRSIPPSWVSTQPGRVALGDGLAGKGSGRPSRTSARPWQAVTVEFEEVAEATGDRVLAVEHWRTRGRDGIEIVTTITNIYAFRDGLIVRVDGFLEKADALEAVNVMKKGPPR